MSTSKKCGHSVPCGCNDTPFTTQPPCESGTPNCPVEKCPETFCGECVIHCNDTIIDSGIENGDSMLTVLQRLTIAALDPTCINLSPVGLKSEQITSSTIEISWLPRATAIDYTVEYKKPADVSWTIMTPTTPSGNNIEKEVIGSLDSESDYHIRVMANDGSTTCYSVTILVKTL